MRRLLSLMVVVSAILIVLVLTVSTCGAAAVQAPTKEQFVAGWAFGDPDNEGSTFVVAGNTWMKMNPEGLNITNTGGPTNDTPYADALAFITYQTEMEINLTLPKGTPAGVYTVRVLVCENWWADGDLHRKTYNLELNGKQVASEVACPVNKGDFTIADYDAKIGADGVLTIDMTAGDGGGTDTNLILSGIEVIKK